MERPILVIYMEPAPYVLGLIDELRLVWPQPIDVLYVSKSMTQDWGTDVSDHGSELLPASSFAAIAEIWRRLTSGRYGLVHLAGWGHPIVLAALIMAAWIGMPISVESDTPMPPAKSFISRCKALVKRILYPWLFSLPTVFLPGGTRQAAYIGHYGVPASRIRIVQMTVDVEKIGAYCARMTDENRLEALRRIGVEKKAIRFLYLGRLEPYKGLLDLLEAFEKLAEERQDICLLIVGDGSLRGTVRSASARNGSILYLGRLAGDRVWETYSLADVFVLASHFEPWGLVVNEAMAAGLPVVVTDRVGCADDLVKPSVNGIIVPAGAPEMLRDAMRYLADSPAERARMGEEAARLIKDWTLRNESLRMTDPWKSMGA